jgi:hypothetical protein
LRVGWRYFLGVAGGVAVVATLLTNLDAIIKRVFPSADVSTDLRLATQAATAGDDNSKVSGVWQLAALWDRADNAQLMVIANTLCELLHSDSHSLRTAAAAAIGNAYTETTLPTRRSQLRRLLYGSTSDWYVGVVVKLLGASV